MIAGLQQWANSVYNRVRRVNEVVRVPENSGLTVRQQETGRKALKILGIEESDGLNKQELVIFLYAVGLNPTDDVIDSKLRAFKLHDLEVFTFGHVCHIWHSMLQDLTDEEEILRRAFQFFDKDGNGEISIPELRTTMHELGDLLSEEEILAFMAVMDVNNDGVIGFEEFIGTLKTQAPELINDDLGEDGEDGEPPADLSRAGTAVSQQLASAEPTTSSLKQSHTSIDMGDTPAHRPRLSAVDETAAQQAQASGRGAPSLMGEGTRPGQPVGESTCDDLPQGQEWRSVYSVPDELSGELPEPAHLQQLPPEAGEGTAGCRAQEGASVDQQHKRWAARQAREQQQQQQQQEREQEQGRRDTQAEVAGERLSGSLSTVPGSTYGRSPSKTDCLRARAGVVFIPAASPAKTRASPALEQGLHPFMSYAS